MLSPAILERAVSRRIAVSESIAATYFRRCHLKILIVADSFLYFNEEDFGLSAFVEGLRDRSTAFHPVTVDLAHRGTPSAGRLAGAVPGFRFTAAALAPYHQVWIFAADYPSRNGPRPAISDDERRAIREFMDNGGGVFATGDHDDLGSTVGGYIPRVRSMRRWFMSTKLSNVGVANPGPQGEPDAPRGDTADRHDTNRAGHDNSFQFDDQSDDIPQPIAPRYFGSGMIRTVHPVLCGPNGPIRVLPDHPHEGLCEEPDVNASYTIGTDTFPEYPTGAGGVRPRARVIATATVLAGAVTSNKPPANARTFGVIGAYDGLAAGVGRIVVDATWHHFINVNLIGTKDLSPPHPKALGFLATPSGEAHYEEIKSYFWNIARWLSPGAFRRCIFIYDMIRVVEHGWFREHLATDDLVFTGQLAHRLSYLGKCDRFGWLRDVYAEVELRRPPWWIWLDPFIEDQKVRHDRDEQALEALHHSLLGGVAIELFKVVRDTPKLLDKRGDGESADLNAVARRGVEQGLRDFTERRSRRPEQADPLDRLLAESLQAIGKTAKAH